MYSKFTKTTFLCAVSLALTNYPLQAKDDLSPSLRLVQTTDDGILKVQKINNTTVEVLFKNNQRMTIDFYGDNIFRLFQDIKGGIVRDPIAQPPADILVQNPRKEVQNLEISEDGNSFIVRTEAAELHLDKKTGLLAVLNKKTDSKAFEFAAPISFERNKVILSLEEIENEYFYGGGVQNGRFSHKGKVIAIENQNSWTDGGVASPTPYYWSTRGYGVMFYTFKKGQYDLGAKERGVVSLYHETDYLDVFFMINDGAASLLNDFYQLTGDPVLLPKFGFYQGHLNAYNRDYWKEDEKGILFEDGKYYKEEQKDNGGIKESLNGENGNYQFSARAVIDRYKKYDMPFGLDFAQRWLWCWIRPDRDIGW